MTGSPKTRRAFTLLEVAMSIVVVSVLFVAAINTLGAARVMSSSAADRALAANLAQDLMAEITAHPVEFTGVTDELSVSLLDIPAVVASIIANQRGTYIEAYAYHNWSRSPPQDMAGNPIPDTDNTWTRSVTVKPINAATMTDRSRFNADACCIVVTVSRRGVPLAELTTVRTEAGDTLWFDN